tara:strand:- start:195 stop:413 length:219 start_codon:yes stop_codon:yes gene_type:complete
MTPDRADKVCPKNIFLGCASGLEWTDITRTIDAPKGGINHKLDTSFILINAKKVIQINAPKLEKMADKIFLF